MTKEIFAGKEMDCTTTRVCLVKMKRDTEKIKTRLDGTTLALLSSGHFKDLAYYDALVDRTPATRHNMAHIWVWRPRTLFGALVV